ncbi:hypothetical protein [Acidisphaera rubrifaciens]|uniref:Signal peptide n=1 Tax=Acidisphaera rubrifaciens HS-AP3 TaxID=1231350 RepID=A0A0D6P8J1_9PROT|nr:hypothetical protein [Acidisphaera rubrifaciens]GAN77159.1 signal peptide [Acidisphaera rubrifaciens HS-AP3]
MDAIGGVSFKHARRWALYGAAAMALCLGATRHAAAQSIEPGDLIPAPAGTNVILGYYIYDHFDSVNVASKHPGSGTYNASFNLNLFIERYVHFFNIGDTPAGYQIFDVNGFQSGTIAGANADAGGQNQLALSVFAWPGANSATKTYPFAGIYLYPPVNSAGFGSLGWAGDLQVGISQGYGDHWNFEFTAYGTYTGPTTSPAGKTTQDIAYTLEGWAEYNWNPQLNTSIGWTTELGGVSQLNYNFTGNKTEIEQIRGWVGYFVTPAAQIGLEVNHDFVAVGGLHAPIGLLARALYVF